MGMGVGRRTPGVGANVLFVPAEAAAMEERRIDAVNFILLGLREEIDGGCLVLCGDKRRRVEK